jgi:hypothetical protein
MTACLGAAQVAREWLESPDGPPGALPVSRITVLVCVGCAAVLHMLHA